ncbi:MAG TPA: glycosyltransferase family 39 protein [Chthoniobacterales bacterium]
MPSSAEAHPPSNVAIPRWVVLLILTLIIGSAAAIRIRLLDMPLERDEGEYAYAGQLMLQGIPPYKLAYNMKLPGTYAAYALIMAVFGQTIRGIHLGLIVVNSLTILLTYLFGKRLFGQICGLVAAGVFALLALSHSVLGLAAHATHFMTLFAIAGTVVLLRDLDKPRAMALFSCGLLFGLAFLTKQNGIFFGLAAGTFLLWNERQRRNNWNESIGHIAVFSVGAILPFAITCILLAIAGAFTHFWFWTFSYAGEYAQSQTWRGGLRELHHTLSGIINAAPGIWLLAIASSIGVLAQSANRRSAVLLFGFSVASLASAFPGLYFREHYFIPLLPAAALWLGAGIQMLVVRTTEQSRLRFPAAIAVALVALAATQAIFRHHKLFFRLSPNEAARAIYGTNPFAESLAVADYIHEHSAADARIAVIGSEPQIYFYSHRHSATGYIYTYSLVETNKYGPKMQKEMISEIEAAKPEYLILVHVPWSWLGSEQSARDLAEWINRYAARNFETVGMVDIKEGQPTDYRWDIKAVGAIPRSDNYLRILRRKESF